MHLRHARIFALSVLGVLASGCRESTSPPSVTGTYVLDRVGDAPVPAVIFTDSRGTVRVIADTLVLEANNRGRFVTVQTIEAQGGSGPGAPTRAESRLVYAIVRMPTETTRALASRIAMSFECPIGAACAAGPHLVAWREGAWLVVEDKFTTMDALRYYRRISPAPTQ